MSDTLPELSGAQAMTLRLVAEATVRLSRVTGGTRQRLIDLAMREPPLVDVDGDHVHLTEAGHSMFSSLSEGG